MIPCGTVRVATAERTDRGGKPVGTYSKYRVLLTRVDYCSLAVQSVNLKLPLEKGTAGSGDEGS
jgi:hypothetical protein